MDEEEKPHRTDYYSEDPIVAALETWKGLRRYLADPINASSITAIATVAIAVFTIVYAIASLYLWSATKDSARSAQSAANTAAAQLEMTDRPWVTVDVLIAGPLTYSDAGVQMNFSFIPKNIGHSPAQNVLIIPELIPVFMGDDVREEQNRICKGAAYQTGFPKYVLFPDEQFTQPFGLSMSAESIIAHWGKLPPDIGRPDPIPIALVGCVDYTYGTSQRHHQTGFAFDVNLPDGRLPLRSLAPIPPTSLILRQHSRGGHFAN